MKWNTSFAAEIQKRAVYLQSLRGIYSKMKKRDGCECGCACECFSSMKTIGFGECRTTYSLYPRPAYKLDCTKEDMQHMVYAEIQRIEKWFRENDVAFDEGVA